MDGTLTEPRKNLDNSMLDAISLLAQYADIGIVSGSPMEYIQEQCGLIFNNFNERWLQDLTIMPCNGTQKYTWSNDRWHPQTLLDMRGHIGEKTFNLLMVELIEAQYLCSLTSAHYGYKMTGHHISYRDSMVNWSPIGRNANSEDRELFTTADIKHNIRTKSFNKLIKREELTEKLAFSLGGSTSIDIYPHGWDKTYALNHYDTSDRIWFIGDRCLAPHGNDKPLYDKINQVNPGCAIETSGPTETIKLIQGIISSIEGSSD